MAFKNDANVWLIAASTEPDRLWFMFRYSRQKITKRRIIETLQLSGSAFSLDPDFLDYSVSPKKKNCLAGNGK